MKTAFVLWLCCWAFVTKAQQQVFAFGQLDSLQKVKQKKVFVLVYTDWCVYCKAMDEVVFKDEKIKLLLARYYYLTKLNAEEKQPIVFAGRQFNYKANKGIHDLAIALGSVNGQLSYPASCILNSRNEILYQSHSFINAAQLAKVLRYFAGTTNVQ